MCKVQSVILIYFQFLYYKHLVILLDSSINLHWNEFSVIFLEILHMLHGLTIRGISNIIHFYLFAIKDYTYII